MAMESKVPGEEEIDCDMCEECGKFIINREALLENAPKAAPKAKKVTSPTPEAVLIQMVHEKMKAEKAKRRREKNKKVSGATPIVMTPATQSPMLLFDGKTIRRQFQPAETLTLVREWIEKHHPRTVFTED
ncbi:hypothetical protein GCK72_003071 [Caenorhabditis remanei]|uniref:UBX domain-containing protein n=1 Tax=Caenorhabditis remanei TaxID=31234 RepID=A0A6A5HUG5_CAERE|nr:hypothetical protein GCK72_003071 [Caenorhabditis remanei]KAF1771245.1 hypothetical protein GCK72_003071 [Caenorhabditis remanei]